MLAAEVGGIRPWEMDRFTPAEERAIVAHMEQLARQEEVI